MGRTKNLVFLNIGQVYCYTTLPTLPLRSHCSCLLWFMTIIRYVIITTRPLLHPARALSPPPPSSLCSSFFLHFGHVSPFPRLMIEFLSVALQSCSPAAYIVCTQRSARILYVYIYTSSETTLTCLGYKVTSMSRTNRCQSWWFRIFLFIIIYFYFFYGGVIVGIGQLLCVAPFYS